MFKVKFKEDKITYKNIENDIKLFDFVNTKGHITKKILEAYEYKTTIILGTFKLSIVISTLFKELINIL